MEPLPPHSHRKAELGAPVSFRCPQSEMDGCWAPWDQAVPHCCGR